MRSVVVVFGQKITGEDLRDWVQQQGGLWQDDPALNQGVHTAQDAAVYIDGCTELDPIIDSIELEKLSVMLGEAPRSSIVLHIGHAAHSGELAAFLIRKLLNKWGGILYESDDLLVRDLERFR